MGSSISFCTVASTLPSGSMRKLCAICRVTILALVACEVIWPSMGSPGPLVPAEACSTEACKLTSAFM